MVAQRWAAVELGRGIRDGQHCNVLFILREYKVIEIFLICLAKKQDKNL